MAAKPEPRKKSRNTRRSAGARDKDRIAALEKELRLKQKNDSSKDVAERKRADEGKEFLGELMDHNPSLVFMKDESGRYVYLNNSYKEQFVLSGNWFGKTDFDFWPKESAELFRANDAEVLRSGRTQQFIEDSTDMQGKRYCWLNYKFPFTDSNGNKYVGGIGIDVTDRIRAEEALRESEKKFRAMFEGAGPAIFIADVATGCIIDCNWKAEELTGRSRDELVGLHQTQLHPADKAGVQREQFARHAKGIVFNKDEAEVLHRDGRVIPVIINAAPLKVNGRDIMIGFFFDITERKQAEEALGKNLAVLARSQEIAHLGSWTVDFDTGRFELSDEMYRIYGFESGTVEPTLDLSLKLTHPDDVERYRKFDESMRREGRLGGIDYRIVRPDGSVRYVYVQTDSVVRGLDGRVKTASGVTQDVTDRKRAEEALRGSKAQLEAVFSSMNDAIIIFDAEGKATSANQAAVQFHRFRSTDELLKSLNGYVELLDTRNMDGTPLNPDKWPANRALRGEIVLNQDIAITRRDTGVSWVGNSSAAPIRDERGNVVAVVTTMRDVTEQKRAEEALRDNEARFRQLSESLPQLIWTCQADGSCDYLSQQWVSYTGIPENVQLGYGWLEQVHPDDRERVAREWASTAAIGDTFDIEFRIRKHDGEYRWFKTRAIPLRDTNGILVKWFGCNTDIEDIKRGEAELKVAKSQAELYLDLMGHDINNMHQIAMGYLELVEGMIPDDDPRRELLEKPTEVLQRSAQLIKNVRKLQKLKEGVFQTHVVDVCKLLVDVQREFGAVPHKAIILNMNGCERCHVRANELLHDVFANLVSNAIKHTGDRADITVSVDVLESDGDRHCRVSVEDNGPGIPDDFKDQIFNRVLKGTNKAKGMGLGLYLVKSLIDSYGGRVWVEDRVPGDHTKGARFVVMLPAK